MSMNTTTTPHAGRRYGWRWVAGPLVALLTVAVMLGAGEVYFRFFHLQSDAYNQTLMAKRWLRECWQPIFTVENPQFVLTGGKFEFRDRTWTAQDVAGKTRVMIVGDSFAAGHGVCNVADRFGDVLARQLGEGYAVLNVAGNGWGTQEQTYYPLLYPFTPNIVVLSYFVNDIENTVKTTPNAALTIPRLAEAQLPTSLLENSYLADYVYWQIIYKRQFEQSGGAITRTLLDAYDDPAIWAAHERELAQFIAWTRQHDAPLVVVIWPRLDAIDLSRAAVTKVAGVFTAQKIPVINAADLLAGQPTAALIANPADTHPSAYAHRVIADALYAAVRPPATAP